MTDKIGIPELGTVKAAGEPPARVTKSRLGWAVAAGIGACGLGLVAAGFLRAAPAFGLPPDAPPATPETVDSNAKLQEEERMTTTTQRYEVYINAAPQKVWDAITTSEWTVKYGYQGRVDYELKPGGVYRAYATPAMVGMGLPEVVIDGEVVEADPPHKLVHTYRFLFNDDTKAEGFTRITWEIEDTGAGFCRLTLTHELDGAPMMAGMVSSNFSEMGTGGWSWILSDLKSVLETGKRLGAG